MFIASLGLVAQTFEANSIAPFSTGVMTVEQAFAMSFYFSSICFYGLA